MKKALAVLLVLGLVGAGAAVLLSTPTPGRGHAVPAIRRAAGPHRPPRPARAAGPVASGRSHPLGVGTASAGATAVAKRYAVVASSSVAGAASDAWITQVAALCTPRWLATLRRAQHVRSLDSSSFTPQVLATYPSHAHPGAYAVTVELSGPRYSTPSALYVELVLVNGRYLVEAAE